jgi:hypothetical protein
MRSVQSKIPRCPLAGLYEGVALQEPTGIARLQPGLPPYTAYVPKERRAPR